MPISWHKGSLAPTVVAIGWQMDFSCVTVRLDPAKATRLITLAKSVLAIIQTAWSVTWSVSQASCCGFRPFTRTRVPLRRSSLPSLRIFGSVSVIVLTRTWCSLSPLKLPLFRPGLVFCELDRPPSPLKQTCFGYLRVMAESRRIWVQSCSPSRASCRLSDSSRDVSLLVPICGH